MSCLQSVRSSWCMVSIQTHKRLFSRMFPFSFFLAIRVLPVHRRLSRLFARNGRVRQDPCRCLPGRAVRSFVTIRQPGPARSSPVPGTTLEAHRTKDNVSLHSTPWLWRLTVHQYSLHHCVSSLIPRGQTPRRAVPTRTRRLLKYHPQKSIAIRRKRRKMKTLRAN